MIVSNAKRLSRIEAAFFVFRCGYPLLFLPKMYYYSGSNNNTPTMKPPFRSHISVFLLIALFTNIHCENANKDVVEDNILKVITPDHLLTEKAIIEPDTYLYRTYAAPFKAASIKNISAMRFTSRRGATKGLSFSITIYNYANSRSAEGKFKELAAVKTTGDEGGIFSKDYDYVVKNENLLIRLDAGCQYSEASWISLKAQFLNAIKTPKGEAIECLCGGSCR